MCPQAPEPANRAERRAAGSYDRVEQGRRDIEKRWAPIRAARLAAGLPATKAEERKRQPRFLDDAEVEAWWMAEATRLRLAVDLDRTSHRLLAKRLADDAAAEDARRIEFDGPATPPTGDDDLLVAFWRGEIDRWRRRAARDSALALVHTQYADDAERELGAVVLRMQRGTS